MAKALFPLLRKTEGASIVNVGSIDGIQANPSVVGYSVAKGGLRTLTHVLAHEFGRSGVRVNYVARCGSTLTAGTTSSDVRRAELTPLGRMGTPEETVAAVAFLASPEASFVNGTTLTVDGGRTVVTPGCP